MTNYKRFTGLVVFLFLFVSCQKKEAPSPAQPLWFNESVPKETLIQRELSLLPPETKGYIILDIPQIIQDPDLKTQVERLKTKFFASDQKNGKSFLVLSNSATTFQTVLIGLTPTANKELGLISLVIGKFDTSNAIFEKFEKNAADNQFKLTKNISNGLTVYSVGDDPEWELTTASEELMVVGSAELLPTIVSNYHLQPPPATPNISFSMPLTSPTDQKTPAFGWGTLKGDKNDFNIQEIRGMLVKQGEWKLSVKFICSDAKKAMALKKYLEINSKPSAPQMFESVFLKVFLKAIMKVEGKNLMVSWKLSEI